MWPAMPSNNLRLRVPVPKIERGRAHLADVGAAVHAGQQHEPRGIASGSGRSSTALTTAKMTRSRRCPRERQRGAGVKRLRVREHTDGLAQILKQLIDDRHAPAIAVRLFRRLDAAEFQEGPPAAPPRRSCPRGCCRPRADRDGF
jgi:hypothetical protein